MGLINSIIINKEIKITTDEKEFYELDQENKEKEKGR